MNFAIANAQTFVALAKFFWNRDKWLLPAAYAQKSSL